MSRKEHIKNAVSHAWSETNDVLKKVDHGIRHDDSLTKFYKDAKDKESSAVKPVIETVVYAAVREAVDPIHSVIKVATGKTMQGDPISNFARAKEAADLTVRFAKVPRAAKVAYKMAKIGEQIYKAKKR